MQQVKYRITFLTPGFLGNADQNGQWRTPPFKALLRQWWRVVWAARHRFPTDVVAMRRDEGRLFGNAWIKDDFRKSAVRMRLSKWSDGSLTKRQWGNQDLGSKIRHPEVRQPVGPLLYLGYGPLMPEPVHRQQRRDFATVLKGNAAIQAGEFADLSVAMPESDVVDLRAALALMDAYGAVGGRSRNGWGSLVVKPWDETPRSSDADREATPTDEGEAVRRYIRPWADALKLDWPHAIGRDETGPLVWRTAESYADWRALMRDLAILKIGLRTMFDLPQPPHPRPLGRHWLSYPITRHETRQWDKNARLPNTLRLKVRPDRDDPKRLRGVIFHVPCRPPAEFRPDDRAIEGVWRRTHGFLDELTQLSAERRYAMVHRDEVKKSLNRLALERSLE